MRFCAFFVWLRGQGFWQVRFRVSALALFRLSDSFCTIPKSYTLNPKLGFRVSLV